MRRIVLAGLAGVGLTSCLVAARAADLAGCTGCTGAGVCAACVPACKAEWEEKKASKPKYSMNCEYACARGRDPWRAPPPECRCSPPCGNVYVKKRLYKVDGEPKVEKAPKYAVEMVPAAACDCAACRSERLLCWLNPFVLFH